MDARLDARRAATLAVVLALSLLLAVLAPLTAVAAAVEGSGAEDSTAETEAVLEQVDPFAAGLAVAGLLVALGLVFLLARRLFKTT